MNTIIPRPVDGPNFPNKLEKKNVLEKKGNVHCCNSFHVLNVIFLVRKFSRLQLKYYIVNTI